MKWYNQARDDLGPLGLGPGYYQFIAPMAYEFGYAVQEGQLRRTSFDAVSNVLGVPFCLKARLIWEANPLERNMIVPCFGPVYIEDENGGDVMEYKPLIMYGPFSDAASLEAWKTATLTVFNPGMRP
jgi:hypothetical protein